MSSWRDCLEGLPVEARIKALLSYELAADRASGQSVDIVRSALRAVAAAEGIDTKHPWVESAAREIARQPTTGPRAS
jgi:hypothetical protein